MLALLKQYGIISLILVSVIVYLNTLTHGFVYDDSYFSNRHDLYTLSAIPKAFTESYLPNNRTAGFYRPLAIASFAATFTAFGSSSVPFHLTNILLHSLATVLVFLLGRKLTHSTSVAWIAALLFAVHPIHVDAVANIKSRDEIFYAIFFMISLLTFLKSADSKKLFPVYVGISSVSYLLGLFSKEMAVTIPLVCLTFLIWKRMSLARVVPFILGWGISTGIYAWLRYIALGKYFIGGYVTMFPGFEYYISSPATRLLTGFHIYFLYLKTLIFPLYLSATYSYAHLQPITSPSTSGSWVLGLIALVITILMLIAAIKFRSKLLISLLFSWIIFYLPASQILIVGGDVMAERWMYTPSIVFLLIITIGVQRFIHNKKMLIGIVSIIAILLIIRTWTRNPVWASNLAIYSSMVTTAPKSVHAQTALAQEYFYQGNMEQAIRHAEIAHQIYPEYAELQIILGKIAVRQRRFEEAQVYYQHALTLNPKNLIVYDNLSRLYFAQGDFEHAYQNFDFVIKGKRVLSLEDFIFLATILAKAKRYQDSLSVLSQVPKELQKQPEMLFLQAVNFYKLGKKEEVLNQIKWDQNLTRAERQRTLEDF